MEMTLEIPEELAIRLRSLGDDLPRILELGLREFDASSQQGFAGVSDVIEELADLKLQVTRSKPQSIKQLSVERHATIAMLDHRAELYKPHRIEFFARTPLALRKLFAVGLEFLSSFHLPEMRPWSVRSFVCRCIGLLS